MEKKRSRLDRIPLEKRGDLHLFKKGEKSPNPNGRPKGQRNYKTLFREAIMNLAIKNNTTTEAIEETIIQVGIKKAQMGDYKFYQDILDRAYGKPVQKTAITDPEGNNLFDDKTKEKSNQAIQEIIGGDVGERK